ncbi:hypothetical protein C0J52_21323 [Blattella germanica]|nr:hypothetical protein C0J52_21323 [Blattella germanica]
MKAEIMSGKKHGFFSRNAVAIVMVPTLVLIHWGWSRMQDIEILVKKEEKKELPIFIAAKHLEDKLSSFFKKDGISPDDK